MVGEEGGKRKKDGGSKRLCFTRPHPIFSFVCDELDGRFARMLNQSSVYGAVLDMVTDR